MKTLSRFEDACCFWYSKVLEITKYHNRLNKVQTTEQYRPLADWLARCHLLAMREHIGGVPVLGIAPPNAKLLATLFLHDSNSFWLFFVSTALELKKPPYTTPLGSATLQL